MKEGLKIWRDQNGIPHIQAQNELDVFWGQGYVHAVDRGMQLLFMRILGQGRVAELLNDSEESLQIDTFFRRMNWSGHVRAEMEALDPHINAVLDAYTQGINAALNKKVPWELKTLLGYRPEPWKVEDTILQARMLGYLTLAQSQADIERLFVEMVQAGVDQERLEALFPGILGGLDIELLREVTLNERIVPRHMLWDHGLPRLMASNNWIISGSKTASGRAILANDPHLEINRLPNILCENVLIIGSRWVIGATMPGLPSILVGRTPDLAWGVTYAFVDAVDSWIEHCKDGRYYREKGDQWLEFQARSETILRKKHDPLEVTFYENEHGVLDGDPYQEGYYLATRWAAATSGATTMNAFIGMPDASGVAEGMDRLGQIESAWNFVLADARGNIGYQMSGLSPIRREGVSGFVPLPGWKKENDWQGFADSGDMPRIMNPEQGFFATANQDLNAYGRIRPINIAMGPYRAERIHQLLAEGDQLTVSDMFAMQYDVYSLQAERFMAVLRPLLPDSDQGRILRDWDLRYDPDSQGAYLFEQFYKELYRVVFGHEGLGLDVCDFLHGETGTFVDFYENFDRVLLAEESIWFKDERRDCLYLQAFENVAQLEAKPWRAEQQFTMSHILLGGTLPHFFGFDRGPVTAIGGRATIHQGQIYRSAGRTTSFLPCLRHVTDFAEDKLYTNMPGGPSDRRFSKWYCSDLDNWINGRYKEVTADGNKPGISFP